MKTSKGSVTSFLTWLALTALFSTACWFLSQWQFARQEEVQKANAILAANYDSQPSALEEILPISKKWNQTLEYKTVLVSGKYIPDKTFLIRNRPYKANPGFLQLAAFETDGGPVIWVERGWLSTGSLSDSPDSVPQLDSLHRQLTLRLRPAEPKLDRTAPSGQLPSIDLRAASEILGSKNVYLEAYGRLVSETDPLTRGLAIPKPELSEGNHLSYAFQWLLFALMAIGAVMWTAYQDKRRRSGKSPKKLKFLNNDEDAKIEDQILG